MEPYTTRAEIEQTFELLFIYISFNSYRISLIYSLNFFNRKTTARGNCNLLNFNLFFIVFSLGSLLNAVKFLEDKKLIDENFCFFPKEIGN